MKPISLRFRCFGPYREEQFIDFEELAKSGVFLICGETGAGKTTILDAMCYALYGKSSGGEQGDRGDISVMRCDLAKKEEETLVEFIFETGGRRYKFLRSLKYGRKNLHDYHDCMVLQDGSYVPLFENPKKQTVNRKAEELIGLTDRQFRQVVVLPQGQFERFLVSDSAEKETILVSLFQAGKWQRTADEIYRRVTEEDQVLRQELADIRGRLREHRCETVEELRELAQRQTEAVKGQRLQAEAARREESLRKEELDRASRLEEAFALLGKLREEEDRLKGEETKRQEEGALLDRSDRADTLRPLYDALRERRKTETSRQTEADQANRAWMESQSALRRVQEETARHAENREAYAQWQRQRTLLENAAELYQSLDRCREKAEEARKRREKAEKRLERAKKAFGSADRDWLAAMKEQRERIRAYTAAQDRYLDGISGTLASRLEAGQPCPVCGSREHPCPARAEGKRVTEQELELRSQAMEQAGRAVERAAGLRRDAEAALRSAEEAAADARQAALTDQAAWEEMERQKIQGIDTPEQLTESVRELAGRITAYEADSRRLQESLATGSGREQAARIRAEQTKKEALQAAQEQKEAQADWDRACREAGFSGETEYASSLLSPEEKNQKRTSQLRWRADLAHAGQAVREQEARLEGQTAPDMEERRRQLQEAEERRDQTAREYILGQQLLETLEQDVRTLEARRQDHDTRRTRVDADLEFAARLRGRSGISLQRYVLGVMLSSITVEANRLLQHVHGGRYRLYRTDEIAGSSHKGGLELEVLDARSGERRSVTTLSGGEKFLVALSLAIGLSTVVQAQGSGMRLGAMFVDEGFGTLDRYSIYDALEVLQGIRRANGLVGIISHVEMLKDVIAGRIEVVKGENGSRCVIR